MQSMTIVLVNHTTRADLDAAWLERLRQGLQNQLGDFCADYGLAVPAVTTSATDDTTRTVCELAIFATADQLNALGYHELGPEDQPYGKVFADGQTPAEVETTASHECLEMVDDLTAQRYQLASNGIAYAEEACDAVEDQTYADEATGVTLSDYVLPAWYVIGSVGPWNRLGNLTADHQKTKAGYWIEDDGGNVSTNPAEARARKGKAHPSSRTSRRLAAGKARAHRRGDLLADVAQLRGEVARLEGERRTRASSAPPDASAPPPPLARRVHLAELDPVHPAAEPDQADDAAKWEETPAAPEVAPPRRVHLSELEPTPAKEGGPQ